MANKAYAKKMVDLWMDPIQTVAEVKTGLDARSIDSSKYKYFKIQRGKMMDLKVIKTAIIAFVLIAPMSVLAGEEQADKKVPSEYSTMENPFSGSDKTVFERGEFIYSKKCVKCHGEKGDGVGGILAESGIPMAPFNEEYFSERKDGYIFQLVEQGIPDTLMLPFGPGSDDNLSADDIWKAIAFLRERFGK